VFEGRFTAAAATGVRIFVQRQGGPNGVEGPVSLRFGTGFFGGELVGEFSAALQGADGRWTVVRPSDEPFPNDWQRRMMLWLAGCLLLVAPAAWWFANRITAPIHGFAEAAERLGRDPRSPPLTLSGPAEIGKAAQAFNDMQVRIKRYVDDRTAMVGAISHDLRTPLSRIRFKLEAAQPNKDAILSDVAQMEQMIASVLAFIRDASEPRRRERLELLSLVECVVDDAALLGGEVQIADGASLLVDGDPLALQRLFANLVDNALKYGHEANVAVSRDGGQALVEIADKGPGLPDSELEAVFQPFYRSGGARNLDKENGGVGLGLAVARSVARAHGGDVELMSKPDGLTARVTLPLAAVTA
jgi:signal transduction histidine kinase